MNALRSRWPVIVYALAAAPAIILACGLLHRDTALATSSAGEVPPVAPATAANPAEVDSDAARLNEFLDALDRGDAPAAAVEQLRTSRASDATVARARLAAAHRLLAAGSLAAAADMARDLGPQLDRLAPYATYVRASALLARQPAEALAALDDCAGQAASLAIGPRAAFLRIDTLLAQGRIAEALAALAALPAASGNRASGDIEARRVKALDASGRRPEAAALAAALLLDHPLLAYETSTRELGINLERSAAPVLARAPKDKLLARADALYDAGHAAEAGQAYRELGAVAAKDKAHVGLRRGQCALRLGRAREALGLLKSIPATAAGAHEASYFRGRAELSAGSHQRFLAAMQDLARSGDAVWGEQAARSIITYHEDKDGDASLAQAIADYLGRYAEAPAADAIWWKAAWTSWRSGRVDEALARFRSLREKFPASDWAPGARFWSARSLEKLDSLAQAAGDYVALARDERGSFYGLAAARRLSALAASHPELAASASDAIASLGTGADQAVPAPPADSVGAALLELRLDDLACDELRTELETHPDDPARQLLMAQALNRRGEYRDSVKALKHAFPRAAHEGVPEAYVHLLYPLAEWDLIAREAKEFKLDPYFVAAVIHQESRFQQEARSGAGARGLMQIMPQTGHWIARRLGERYSSLKLYEPSVNVRYGAYYMSTLLAQYDGQAELALAGYNAGTHRVSRWLTRMGPGDLDEFVESIPFNETRIYVKNILVSHFQYHRLYGGEPHLDLSL